MQKAIGPVIDQLQEQGSRDALALVLVLVLVLDQIAKFGQDVAAALRDGADEHAWSALRNAMCEAVESLDPESHTGMAFRVLQFSPGIRSSAVELTRT